MQYFKSFLTEKVLSIGLNPSHEKYREHHRQQIHDIIHKSYKPLGGYLGIKSGSPEESDAIHQDISKSMIKAVKRDGKITAINLYKKQHGRKTIASGTDGSEQGKKDWFKTKLEDHEQKRAWGEVSGAPEHIQRKMGVPAVPSSQAGKLLGKKITPVKGDKERYSREIAGHPHVKVIMGYPKKDKG